MHIKQLLALLLAAVLLAGLCACGLKPAEPEKTAEAPELEKGWYAVLDDDDPVGYLYSTGKRVTFLNADGEAELEDIRLKWDAEALAFVIDNSPAFSLEVSKRTVTMTVPKKSPLPYDKGSYTLEEIDEDDLPAVGSTGTAEAPSGMPSEAPGDTPSSVPEAAPDHSAPAEEPQQSPVVDAPFEDQPDTAVPADDPGDPNAELYAQAVSLMEQGDYAAACETFAVLGDYRDSMVLGESCSWYYRFRNVRVGDTVMIGLYEQDNNTRNGSEEIEWLVLDIRDGRMLVISRYALDNYSFNPSANTKDNPTTWETCYLRHWMNDIFCDAAFSELEQTFIAETAITAKQNPDFPGVPAGNDTVDRIFALSLTEAARYFISSEARMCVPTKYTVSKGVTYDTGKYKVNGENTCRWWLRDPGEHDYAAAGVYPSGELYSGGFYANNEEVGVRPAMWIIIAP